MATLEELNEIIAEMERIWNLHAITEATREVYREHLAEFDAWRIRAAIREIRRVREWAPNIAALRGQIEHLPWTYDAEDVDRFLRDDLGMDPTTGPSESNPNSKEGSDE